MRTTRPTVRHLIPMLAALALPAHAADAAPKDLRAFEQFVRSEMAARQIPGLSIGYARDGVTWTQGYGYADLENKVPMRADASYRLASVTKPMTAVAILKLAEQGKLSLDAEVQTYVPYFPRKPFPITVRQLLGHLAGINAYVNSQAEQHFKEHKDTRQSVAVFEHFDLVAEPGTRFRYTSYGYNLLGAVIEGASGVAYADYMKASVWGPLGMTATRLDDPLDLIPQRVRGYQLVDRQLKHSEFIDISSRFAAGGTRSSVPDMLRFGQGVSQGKVLSAEHVALMGQAMVTRAGELTDYGMGWNAAPLDGKYMIAHDGVQPETSTHLFVFPSRKLSIAVAANLQRVELTAFASKLFEAVTGEAWTLDTHVRNAALRPYYDVMQGLYNEGRAHIEAGRPPIADIAVVNAAFAFLNAQVGNSSAIAQARHPKGGLHLLTAGSTMARALAASGVDLGRYSNTGAIAFFHDYLALCRRGAGIPAEQRFTPAFEQAVATLHADWLRTSRASKAKLALRMKAYAGAQAYPNHVPTLRETAFRLLSKGDQAGALKAAQLALAYYDDADAAQTLFGAVSVIAGDAQGGELALRKSLALAPAGSASATALNALAYQVAAGGAKGGAGAIALLQLAVQVHPADANLRDTLGEFHAMAGDKDRAALAYQEALAINPQYPNAGTAREFIRAFKR